MSRGIWVRAWEDYALFNRPEMKAERYSYDVMTPSAAGGVLGAIYWYPGTQWVIDKMCAREPIRSISIRRDEVESKVLAGDISSTINGGGKPLYISSREEIVQKAAILLRDVGYMVETHSEMTFRTVPGDNEDKFKDIIVHRLRKGECYHRSYFGCQEFPTQFVLYEEGEVDTTCAGTERGLEYILLDFGYSDTEGIKPMFLRAIIKDSVLDIRSCEVVR